MKYSRDGRTRTFRFRAPNAAVYPMAYTPIVVNCSHFAYNVPSARLELATYRLGGGCSIH